MMYLLVISSNAKNDFFEAISWYEDKREGLSIDFELCIEAGLFQIISNPFSFQERYKNVRINFIERFPYGIHYRIIQNKIEVLGFFHTSRNPTNWFSL